MWRCGRHSPYFHFGAPSAETCLTAPAATAGAVGHDAPAAFAAESSVVAVAHPVFSADTVALAFSAAAAVVGQPSVAEAFAATPSVVAPAVPIPSPAA